MDRRTYAEKYAMRSRFYQLLGEAGRLLAHAYCQADTENQGEIKDLAFSAMADSLVEHHGYQYGEIQQRKV